MKKISVFWYFGAYSSQRLKVGKGAFVHYVLGGCWLFKTPTLLRKDIFITQSKGKWPFSESAKNGFTSEAGGLVITLKKI